MSLFNASYWEVLDSRQYFLACIDRLTHLTVVSVETGFDDA